LRVHAAYINDTWLAFCECRPTYGAKEEQVLDPLCVSETRRQLKPDHVGRPRHPNPLASLSLPTLSLNPCPLALAH
jgi:hypothetical protein